MKVSTSLPVFLIILTAFMIAVPEFAFAQKAVNIQGSITSLTNEIRMIGLVLLGCSIVVGGTLMGFANPMGTKIVISAILGAVVLLISTGIIELIKRTV